MKLYLIENLIHLKMYVVASNLQEAIEIFKQTYKNTDDDYEIINGVLVSNQIIIKK